MAVEKRSVEGSLNSSARVPPALRRLMLQEVTGDRVWVGYWITAPNIAVAGMFTAPDVGAGLSTPVVPPVAIEG
jgi:hypothetical protein